MIQTVPEIFQVMQLFVRHKNIYVCATNAEFVNTL